MQLHNKILSNFPLLLGRQQRNSALHFRSELMQELSKIGHKSKPENPELLANVGTKRGLSERFLKMSEHCKQAFMLVS
jgi:hypothetical protein